MTVRVVVEDLPSTVAVKVTTWAVDTPYVVTANVPCAVPPVTVAVDGTEAAAGLELVNVTVVPDGPALPFRLIVPVTVIADPPSTEVGDTVTDITQAGKSVRLHVFVVAPRFAERVIEVFESTPRLGMGKVAVDDPAGIVTVPGGIPLASDDERKTIAPPTGAGATNVIVPVGKSPPTMEDGEQVKVPKPPGVTVRPAELLLAPKLAVIVAICVVAVAPALSEKLAELCPGKTFTVGGALAKLGRLLDRVIVVPDGPAGPFRVTIPADDPPPGMDDGFRVTEVTRVGFTVNAPSADTLPDVPVTVTGVLAITEFVETAKSAVA